MSKIILLTTLISTLTASVPDYIKSKCQSIDSFNKANPDKLGKQFNLGSDFNEAEDITLDDSKAVVSMEGSFFVQNPVLDTTVSNVVTSRKIEGPFAIKRVVLANDYSPNEFEFFEKVANKDGFVQFRFCVYDEMKGTLRSPRLYIFTEKLSKALGKDTRLEFKKTKSLKERLNLFSNEAHILNEVSNLGYIYTHFYAWKFMFSDQNYGGLKLIDYSRVTKMGEKVKTELLETSPTELCEHPKDLIAHPSLDVFDFGMSLLFFESERDEFLAMVAQCRDIYKSKLTFGEKASYVLKKTCVPDKLKLTREECLNKLINKVITPLYSKNLETPYSVPEKGSFTNFSELLKNMMDNDYKKRLSFNEIEDFLSKYSVLYNETQNIMI